MFTGIISHRGRFAGFRGNRSKLAVEAPGLAAKVAPGGSVAVNGVCLTLVGAERDTVLFDVSRETLSRSTLGSLRPGAPLNLELPLTLADPLGGHLVSGHVDATGRVLRSVSRPPGRRLAVAYPAALRPFLVEKGSVAVDGVSLTVASLTPSAFEVELVPATLATTDLGGLRSGAKVNLECDMVGKYVYNSLSRGHRAG